MNVNPYLMFNGNCREALQFYVEHLGARLEGVFSYGESPDPAQMPPGWEEKVMHAALFFGESQLMASDAPPGMYEKPQGISVTLNLDQGAEAERAFTALAEGGQVLMPIAETFWADRFGAVIDRFGIPWSINGGFKQGDCSQH